MTTNQPNPTGQVTTANEQEILFLKRGGHNHDGQNSSAVALAPGVVNIGNLDPSLLALLTSAGSGNQSSNSIVPLPDLIIQTTTIAVGGQYTGAMQWAGNTIVRYMRILQSVSTECRITFYHSSTYAEQDREFRAENCGNYFLWEGNWAHNDDLSAKSIYYKIENTGTSAAQFQITLKSATAVANAYASYVSGMQLLGSGIAPFTNTVILQSGNGVTITQDVNSNSFKFDAVAPTAVNITKWALNPIKPVAASSSANGNETSGYIFDGYTSADTARYVTFGANVQWFMTDLGSIRTVGHILALQYWADGRTYNNVRIEVSTDGVNFVVVRPDGPNYSTQQGINVHIPGGIQARYIRLWSNGASPSVSDINNHVVKLLASELVARS